LIFYIFNVVFTTRDNIFSS